MFRREFVGITDYEGNDIHEGDIIKWPNDEGLGVVRYEPNSCQFRIQFDPSTYASSCHVGLQMGEKGQARVVGSVYDDISLVPWAEQNGA